MRYPIVKRATDLPYLRDWLLGCWGTDTFRDLFRQEASFVTRHLPDAPLWWVDGEACELLGTAAETYPDDAVLDDTTPPSLSGFAVLERPLVGTDAVTGVEVQVGALMWGPTRFLTNDDTDLTGISVGLFTRHDPGMGLGKVEMNRPQVMLTLMATEHIDPSTDGVIVGEGAVYAMLGRTDWLHGTPLSADVPGNPHKGSEHHDTSVRSMVEDRKLLACLWQLARTPIMSTTDAHFTRAERRRAERRGGGEPRVRVLGLRPHEGGASGSGVTTGGRTYSHRWVVRPHWRYQAHGPGRVERKLILVGPYMKGPDGAPVIGGARVWKVAGDE